MISYFPDWWIFLTYDSFKSHLDVTEDLDFFAENRIKVGKDDSGTNTFNQLYDYFQVKEDKLVSSQLLYMI